MIKKYSVLSLAIGIIVFAYQSNAQTHKTVAKKSTTVHHHSTGYIKDANGLEHKVIVKGKGLISPQLGDVVEAHVFQKLGDSVIMNTYVMQKGQPVPIKIQASTIKGDLMEGIRQMKVGDSTLFRIKLDTLIARTKQQPPAWVKKGAYLTWGVKLVSIKPKTQVDIDEKKAQEEQAKTQLEAQAHSKEQAATDDSLIQAYLATNKITDAKKTASGLYYVVHNAGEGPNATAGQKVTVNYTGRNIKGETFDSNVDSAFHHVSPFDFTLGQHQVISGWDEGIALMNKGEKITLYIPSGMAYGAMARAAQIPANAILIFDVELVGMANAK